MQTMNLHILSVRHGQIEDGPYWCKVNTLTDEIETGRGFHGQRTVEFSVPSENAKQLAESLTGCLPAMADCTAQLMVEGGKPTLKLTSAKVVK